MAAAGGRRQPSVLFTISAVGMLIIGILMMISTVNRAFFANRRSDAFERLKQQGYGTLIPDEVVISEPVYVVVTTVPLRAGDAFIPEFLELRTVQRVIHDFPELDPEARSKRPDELELHGFYNRVDDVVNKYAVIDLAEGAPIGYGMVLDASPFANPRDDYRRHRFTIAMPEPPTLHPLLQPGDRVDIMAVYLEKTVVASVLDVRVVAVDNLLVEGSGLLSTQQEQAAVQARAEAASRKAARLRAEAQRRNQPTPQAEPPPSEDGEPTPEEEAAAEDDALAAEELPEDVIVTKRRWDGRTLTLQVSAGEAWFLAMIHREPRIRLDFAVHPR